MGTLSVESYERPAWKFNKLLFVEKEGFAEVLRGCGFLDRHDCGLLCSKGQSTGAAKDLIDLIGETDEPVQVFCLHDCDASGTLIFEKLQDATRARPARKIQIINLGLDVEEVLELAEDGTVEIEDLKSNGRSPVAQYAKRFEAWFQSHRCELNAFSTPDLIRWLDAKMEQYGTGKLIPPSEVLRSVCESKLESMVREKEVALVLAEANIDGLVKDELRRLGGKVKALTGSLPDPGPSRVAGEPATVVGFRRRSAG